MNTHTEEDTPCLLPFLEEQRVEWGKWMMGIQVVGGRGRGGKEEGGRGVGRGGKGLQQEGGGMILLRLAENAEC
jgi:hypothetical protein